MADKQSKNLFVTSDTILQIFSKEKVMDFRPQGQYNHDVRWGICNIIVLIAEMNLRLMYVYLTHFGTLYYNISL